MKLKSLKLAVATALAAPMLLISGSVMAAECVGDELPNCDNAVVQINEDVSSATDHQVVTTEWSGETSVATGTVGSGFSADIGDIRPTNVTLFTESNCVGGKVLLASTYNNYKDLNGTNPEIAGRYDQNNSENKDRYTKFSLGKAYLANQVKIKLTMSSPWVTQGDENIRFELLKNDAEIQNSNCSRNQSCWPSGGNAPFGTFTGNFNFDAIRVSGDGGKFNECQGYTIDKIEVFINGESTATAELTF